MSRGRPVIYRKSPENRTRTDRATLFLQRRWSPATRS